VDHANTIMDQVRPGESIVLVAPDARHAIAPPQRTSAGRATSGPSCPVAAVPIADDPLETFRRAIVEGDQAAWEALYAQYQHLVRSWLRRHAAARLASEGGDYLVNRAFERFWLHVKPERFTTFTGLQALLQYLKLCAHCALLDDVRAQARRHALRGHECAPISAVEEIGEREAARVLWQTIYAEAHDESERLVATLTFVNGLKPREIYAAHPDRYADVAEVYRLKRNLIDRLRRDETVQMLRA
jgi:DNA-directed RNA polymerase specialized sigma24 family protein